jgi:dihydrofolate synthase/folylpolyglutamate synthase
VAVVEVGLGGRLDATNVITPLVSVITTISKDHEAYLGPDELSIAREKGGIIKSGVPVVLGKVSEPVAELLERIAQEQRSSAYFLGRDFSFSLKNNGLFDYIGIKQHFSKLNLALRGRHQRANAALALAALELAQERYPVKEGSVGQGLQTVRWPGRLEVMLKRPLVILDGAHNPEGIRALVEELNDWRQGHKIRLLFATMADKEWELMLRAMTTCVDEVVLTRVDMERSADPHQLAEKIPQMVPHRVIDNSHTALRALLTEAAPEDVIVVAGSLYLLGEVRPLLEGMASTKTTGGSADSRI